MESSILSIELVEKSESPCLSAILCRFLLDSLPFSFLLQNWLPWRPYISMKLLVFIPLSFEQSFSQKTSFPENEFLCWATGEGGRKKLHGTTENLPSSKQSSEPRISESIYVLKLVMYNSGFLPKIQLCATIHSSLNKLCLTNSCGYFSLPRDLSSSSSQASKIPHPSKGFQTRTALPYLSMVTRHSTASR